MGTSIKLIAIAGLTATFAAGCKKSDLSPNDQSWRARSSAIRQENQQLVQQALDKMQDGEQIQVDESVEPQPGYQCGSLPTRFQLQREGNRLAILLKIQLQIDPDSQRDGHGPEMIAQTEACTTLVQSVWGRYGIDFKAEYLTDSNDTRASDRKVTLMWGRQPGRAPEQRSNSEKFYTGEDSYFQMVLHELGHQVGLPDEYEEDGTCRTASSASVVANDGGSFSIMDSPFGELERKEFMPRHLQTILGPVDDTPRRHVDEYLELKTTQPFPTSLVDFRPSVVFGADVSSPVRCTMTIEGPGYDINESNTAPLLAGADFENLRYSNRIRAHEGWLKHFQLYPEGSSYDEVSLRELRCDFSSQWNSSDLDRAFGSAVTLQPTQH